MTTWLEGPPPVWAPKPSIFTPAGKLTPLALEVLDAMPVATEPPQEPPDATVLPEGFAPYEPPSDPRLDSITLWEFFQVFISENGINIPLKAMHREVCEYIEQALLGETPEFWFLLLNMPPRIGKTKLVEAAVCWHYGLFPRSHFIWTSYNNPLACESSRYIQRTMNSEWYKILFPRFRLGEMQQTDNFTTEAGGRFKADGANAMLAGFGAGDKVPAGGAIIIDDPANPNEALSKIEVEKLQFWLENTIMRRRNSDRWTPIIVISQRLGGDDLPGFILKNYAERTKHLKFKGFDDDTQLSNFPETISAETMLKMREVNKYAFSAQIQQEPQVMGGNMIKVEEFRYFDGEAPLKFDWLALYCDTAWKTREHNDWSVIGVAGRMATGCYLLDLARGKWESPDMIANIRQMWRKWQQEAIRRHTWLRKVVVEDHASGTAAIQFLRREGIAMEPRIRVRDKVERVEDILPFISSGQVHISKTLPYLNEFLDECAGFRKDGKHKHDDCVDCASDAISDCLGKALTIFDVLGTRPRGR